MTDQQRAQAILLYNLYAKELFQYAYGSVSDQRYAEDLVQTAFAVLCEALEQETVVQYWRAWLYAVVRNTILSPHSSVYSARQDTLSRILRVILPFCGARSTFPVCLGKRTLREYFPCRMNNSPFPIFWTEAPR